MRKSCISFDSYIKPQLHLHNGVILLVVYLLIPTSNHNSNWANPGTNKVVYLLIPTSNHNVRGVDVVDSCVVYLLIPTSNHNVYSLYKEYRELYIFWFLHQTTTIWESTKYFGSCISFDSYIKPQPLKVVKMQDFVVYLLIPTSNHNLAPWIFIRKLLYIFWFLHQTTTVNHFTIRVLQLYIFWFLHQTTTKRGANIWFLSCISFDSYIKPQPYTPR